MPNRVPTNLRGILNPSAVGRRFELRRHAPSDALSGFVDWYWIVSWDLRDEAPYPSETLPFPAVNVVFEANDSGARSAVHGVSTRRFERVLSGRGNAFGVKFHPGAFEPWAARSIHELTDRVLSLSEIFGDAAHALDRAMLSNEGDAVRVARVDAFLEARIPSADANVANLANVEIVRRAVRIAQDAATPCDVDALALAVELPVRTLQRLFRRYVGVNPKWVLRRSRIHDAAERVAQGMPIEWASLAHDLGYFDQAHFVRDWKSHVGRTPTEYEAQCRGEASPNRTAAKELR